MFAVAGDPLHLGGQNLKEAPRRERKKNLKKREKNSQRYILSSLYWVYCQYRASFYRNDTPKHANGLMQEGVYTGERNDGKLRHGKGRIDWPNGDFYEGDFNDGLRSGKGVYSCKGGKHIYEGEWKLGKRHGQGVESWPNGQTVTP